MDSIKSGYIQFNLPQILSKDSSATASTSSLSSTLKGLDSSKLEHTWFNKDFSGEPCLFILGVLTRVGGVLYEPTFPTLKTSNPNERFATDLIFAQRRGGFMI